MDLMDGVAAARNEKYHRVINLLPLDPGSPIARILRERGMWFSRAWLGGILETVATIVKGHDVRARITDWPFENFWGSRIAEPRHSKLIGFFANPDPEKAGHNCGRFLLDKFLKAIAPEQTFNVDQCKVRVEFRPTDFGQIDILIYRKCGDDNDFAVIIENKVNYAGDQDAQLERYVTWLLKVEGFRPDQIYVRYLPLTPEKMPNPADLAALKNMGVNQFARITFENHILGWLTNALAAEWPGNTDEDIDMRENLVHYRNFLRYLVNNKYKRIRMNTDILNSLAEANISLSSLGASVDQLKTSTTALEECMRCARLGTMLLATYRNLKQLVQKDDDTWLCLENDPLGRIKPTSCFDPCFQQSVNVCIHATAGVKICFGGNPDGKYWFGYMKHGDSSTQEKIGPSVILEAEERYKGEIIRDDEIWYAYWFHKVVYFDGCEEHLATGFAKTLVGMRDGILQR
jgi:hypothetical protein